ncbi:CHAT domain-containing protein [Streptomyces sp. NPDC051366]|uniref:CHAT domain-containing protein n=1 Tax=Streptomyces sp. NPDC051366 TaxID=3365652 RepID=UPI0037BD1182
MAEAAAWAMRRSASSRGGHEPAAQAVLTEYFAIGDSLVAFVMRPEFDHPEVVELPLGRRHVAALVRDSVVAPGPDGRPLGAAEEWAETAGTLVEPALRFSRPGEILWFVGHDVLHLLPLHAAPLPGGEWLLDRNPVCYAPSATVMRHCRRKVRGRGRGALVVGDPGGDLPHAREEARAVGSVLGADPLIGARADREKVLAHLEREDPALLHFACHGFFDAVDPLSSGIGLAGGGDARLTVRDLLTVRLHPDLVTLSACRTGLHRLAPGDELIGLSRALLYAGARAAVLTLWNVSDFSTRLLMARFYTALRTAADLPDSTAPTRSPAEALREAQLHVKSLTAQAVIDGIDEELARTTHDPERQLTALRARARMQLEAGDPAEALTGYQAALDLLPALPHPADPSLAARLSEQAALLHVHARARAAPDYGRRPFAHPYHWAPFVLHGDWS